MPFSTHEGKQWSERKVTSFSDVNTIVDVGTGEGIYSMLLRCRFPHAKFIGIEGFEPYVEQFELKAKYDELIVADVRELLFLPFADVTIFGDVLEHMPESDARDLVSSAKLTSRAILVSVPIVCIEQGAVNGNELERHHVHYSFDEMHAMLNAKDSMMGETVGVFWWERDSESQN